jgi:hypothetical protein
MSPLILSAFLLSSLTKPLSPAEVRSKPEPGSLAFGLYAVRAAASVRKGMAAQEVQPILGGPNRDFLVVGKDLRHRYYSWHRDWGVVVTFVWQDEVVGGKGVWHKGGPGGSYRVERVCFGSLPAFRPIAVGMAVGSRPEAVGPTRDPEGECFDRIGIGMDDDKVVRILREYGFTATWGVMDRKTGGIREFERANGTEIVHIVLTYKDFRVDKKWLKRPSSLWQEGTGR